MIQVYLSSVAEVTFLIMGDCVCELILYFIHIMTNSCSNVQTTNFAAVLEKQYYKRKRHKLSDNLCCLCSWIITFT